MLLKPVGTYARPRAPAGSLMEAPLDVAWIAADPATGDLPATETLSVVEGFVSRLQHLLDAGG